MKMALTGGLHHSVQHESQQQAAVASAALAPAQQEEEEEEAEERASEDVSSRSSCIAVLGQSRRHPLRGPGAVLHGPDVSDDVSPVEYRPIGFLGGDSQCFLRAPGIQQSLVQCLHCPRYTGK